ncbi:hypothetical protein GCM10010341_76390 [Streptomyces noursei]|nr:hypothetical protein GCM10010341_76390 [Streptomyces noursei]
MTCWTQWRDRVGEAWNRHVRYRESYRQLDAVRDVLRARTAWLNELTEEELDEMQRGLAACLDALRATAVQAPEHPESTS